MGLVSLVMLLLGQPSALALSVDKLPFFAHPQVEKTSDLVFPDYLERDRIINNYEQQVRQSPDSFLLLRLLADQYLKRFRERADVEYLLRGEQAARRSLAIQPRQNGVSSLLLA